MATLINAIRSWRLSTTKCAIMVVPVGEWRLPRPRVAETVVYCRIAKEVKRVCSEPGNHLNLGRGRWQAVAEAIPQPTCEVDPLTHDLK